MTDKPSKLFIDEDWKSQVQAEKDALAQKQAAEAQPAAKSQPADPPVEAEEVLPPGPMPAPTFTALCTILATQAMIALGQAANPQEKNRDAFREQAKFFIDLLAMLDTKTQGNRTPEEISVLSNSLHELRMLFVQA